jgi:hypothetical protein
MSTLRALPKFRADFWLLLTLASSTTAARLPIGSVRDSLWRLILAHRELLIPSRFN